METKKSNKKIIALIVAIVVVIVAVCAVVYVKNNSKPVDVETERVVGNTPGNISNLGAVVDDGDYSYYQNSDDKYAVYKSKKGSSKGEKINSSASYFLNVMGDYIYYANGDDDFNVYRMKKDGSDNKKIISTSAYYMTVTKDYIFYVD